MLYLILIVLWFAFALLIEGIVDTNTGPFVKTWKSILFTILTLPSRWITLVKSFLPKLAGSAVSIQIAHWFKS